MLKITSKKKILLCMKALPAVMLIGATIIATVCIPKVEEKIHKEKEVIEKFKYDREIALIHGLYASETAIQRRLNFLDASLESVIRGDAARKDRLLKQVLDNTIGLIKVWHSWFRDEQANDTIQIPIFGNQLTTTEKIAELEVFLNKTREKAITRLTKASEEVYKHKLVKENYEKNSATLKLWFIWLQILGLILLSSSEIIEKLFFV